MEIPDPLIQENPDRIIAALCDEFAEGEDVRDMLFIQKTHLAGLAVRSGLVSLLDLLP